MVELEQVAHSELLELIKTLAGNCDRFEYTKGQDTCYSAAYMSQTRDQQRFYNLGSGS